jgi:hypothetical protein
MPAHSITAAEAEGVASGALKTKWDGERLYNAQARMIRRYPVGSFHICQRAGRRNVHSLTRIRCNGFAHNPSKSNLVRRHQLGLPT